MVIVLNLRQVKLACSDGESSRGWSYYRSLIGLGVRVTVGINRVTCQVVIRRIRDRLSVALRVMYFRYLMLTNNLIWESQAAHFDECLMIEGKRLRRFVWRSVAVKSKVKKKLTSIPH